MYNYFSIRFYSSFGNVSSHPYHIIAHMQQTQLNKLILIKLSLKIAHSFASKTC